MSSSYKTAPHFDKHYSPTFFVRASLGLISGWQRIVVSGHNEDIDTATVPETISDITGGGVYPFPTSASTASIVSGSADDAAEGTGARTAIITGLDASYNLVSETITFTGVTPVVTTQSFFRINSIAVLTFGSGGANAGEIDVTVDSSVVATLNAGDNLDHNGVYTVPAGKTFMITEIQMAIGKQGSAEASLKWYIRDNANSLPFYDTVRYSLHSTSGTIVIDLSSAPFIVSEKSDIKAEISEITANNCNADFVMLGYLVDNDKL